VKRVWLFAICMLLFLLEGTLVQILIPNMWRSDYSITPHLTLIAIIFISLYLGGKEGLFYGLIFGALYDLVNGSVWGLLLFTYGLIGNGMGLMTQLLHRNLWLILTSVGMGSLLLDTIQFGFFRMFQFTSLDWSYVFFRQIIPSSLLNILLVFLLYPVFHKLLLEIMKEKEEKEGRN